MVAAESKLVVVASTLVTRQLGVWKAFEHQTFPVTLTRGCGTWYKFDEAWRPQLYARVVPVTYEGTEAANGA